MPKILPRTEGLADAHRMASMLGCAFIMLPHGKFALVDYDDAERLSGFYWHADDRGYVFTKEPLRPTVKMSMHRFILGFPDREIDHKNGNRMDNRRCNLRPCTPSQNLANKPPRKNKKHSPHKGVRASPAGKYEARCTVNGKSVHLGTFITEKEAATAYNEWAVSRFGEFAYLNKC